MEIDFRKKRALELWTEGQELQRRGKLEKAVELYKKSIDIFPTAEAYTFLGWAFSFQGRIDDAISQCKQAIEVDPTLGNPYNDIGSYLIGQGNLDEAIQWLEKAKSASRYEAKHFPYINLGRVFAAKGLILRAITEFEGALKICPDDPTSVSALKELRNAIN